MEPKTTKIKIPRGRKPTPEQLRRAVALARERQDDQIVLVSPDDGAVWAAAAVDTVEEYIKQIDRITWPFTNPGKKRGKVVIE